MQNGNRFQKDLLIYLNSPLSEKNKLVHLLNQHLTIPENYRVQFLKSIAKSFSSLNYNAFSTYVDLAKKGADEFSFSSTRTINLLPTDCFEFSITIQRMLQDRGFGDVKIFGTEFTILTSEDQLHEQSIDHTGVVIYIDGSMYLLDPFNNLAELVKLQNDSSFSDKRGKLYKIKNLDSGEFTLSYKSSKGQDKSIQFAEVSPQTIKANTKRLINHNQWRVLYASYEGSISNWISYDPIKRDFNSNLDVFQNLDIDELDESHIILLFKIFKDRELLKSIDFLKTIKLNPAHH
jgi:hypothetical protein